MRDEQRPLVVAEALGWVNTPYHPHARVKGVGVDCAMLLAEVYERAGVIPHVDPGHYSPQFGLHRDEEVFEEFVLRHGVEVDAPEPGDCVLFRYGRCYSHGGIMVSEVRFVHAMVSPPLVVCTDLSDAEVAERERRFYTVVSS
jgi:cell wall-associated NlpC family hydrolase